MGEVFVHVFTCKQKLRLGNYVAVFLTTIYDVAFIVSTISCLDLKLGIEIISNGQKPTVSASGNSMIINDSSILNLAPCLF